MADTVQNAREFRVPTIELVVSLSKALDLVNPAISDHHLRVAYLSNAICTELGMTRTGRGTIAAAAALHDVGVLNLEDKLLLAGFDHSDGVHAERGFRLLALFEPFEELARMIRYHHTDWETFERMEGGIPDDVVMGNCVIRVADRAATLIDSRSNVIGQVPRVVERCARYSGTRFRPEVIEALSELAGRPYFWLDLVSPSLNEIVAGSLVLDTSEFDMEGLIELARLYSKVIDFRCRFTATHSAGVAVTSEALGRLLGFSEDECLSLRVAGYLHDIGKLAVPNEILQKPGRLTREEYQLIISHPYHSYRVLEPITDLGTINRWGSYHHERIDGSGYPFKYSMDELPTGSRVVAVADVFTAIAEDRPYRPAMPPKEVRRILRSLAALDMEVVTTLLDSFGEVSDARASAQAEVASTYDELIGA